MADLKRKSVRGGMVTFASQAISVGIQLASTVTLARLLSPDDYGIMAMVVAITAFAGLFRDLGLSAAAIQKGNLTQAQMSNLFWLNAGMGALLTVLLAAASPLVAWFYGKPELMPLTLALSSTFLIGSLGTQHGALMQREMRFGRRAVTSIAGSLITLAVSIVLAVRDGGYWALAWGNIVGAIVTTILLIALSPFRPGLWTRGAGVRSMLKFGANITAFDFVNYFSRNLDNLLIGKFWGPDALGLYSRAYNLLMFPINSIRGPINSVAFPAMSRLQSHPTAYRTYYRKVTQLLAFVSMPLTAFLCVASAPIIGLLLGNAWLGVAPIFSLLAITSFIQPVAGLRGLVLQSSGQGGRYVQWGILNAVCVSIGFLIGVRWGATGIAASYAIVNYAILYPSLLLAFKNTSLRPRDFFVPISIPSLASIGAGFVSYACTRMEWMLQMPDLGKIACLAVCFGGIYLLFTALLPGGWRDLKHIAGLLYRRRNDSARVNSPFS